MATARSSTAAQRHSRARLTGRGQVFVGAGVGLVTAGAVLGYDDITRVGIFLLVLPLFAVLLSSSRATGLQLRRTIDPAVVRPDEPALVRAVFRNTGSRASRFGAVLDRIDATLGDRPRYTLATIPARGTATVSYPVRSRVRGAHTLGPAVIQHPDPFGLCTATTVVPAQDELLVLPHTFPLAAQRLAPATGGDGDSGHFIALHGEQDVSIRSYVEGDELRRIHWPATAHRGQLMVRHEDRPEREHALLVYDARGGAHQSGVTHSSFEWTISAIASMALHLNSAKYQTHLLSPESLADAGFEIPSTDDSMLRELARAQECTDVTHGEMLTQAARLAAAGTTVVAVVTDVPDPRLGSLAAACGRGAVGVAVIVDTAAYRQHLVPDGASARHIEQVFKAAGWRTTIVGPDSGIPAAWRAVTGGRTLETMPR